MIVGSDPKGEGGTPKVPFMDETCSAGEGGS